MCVTALWRVLPVATEHVTSGCQPRALKATVQLKTRESLLLRSKQLKELCRTIFSHAFFFSSWCPLLVCWLVHAWFLSPSLVGGHRYSHRGLRGRRPRVGDRLDIERRRSRQLLPQRYRCGIVLARERVSSGGVCAGECLFLRTGVFVCLDIEALVTARLSILARTLSFACCCFCHFYFLCRILSSSPFHFLSVCTH